MHTDWIGYGQTESNEEQPALDLRLSGYVAPEQGTLQICKLESRLMTQTL